MAGYWFGTCGVTGRVTPLDAGAGAAGAGVVGAGVVVPFVRGVVVVVPPAPVTTAVWSEIAGEVPLLFFPVTRERIVWPTSLLTTA